VGRLELSLEHKVLQTLRLEPLPPGRCLLAVSGGLDSMVLAEILWRWRRYLKIEIIIAHVHHGQDGDPGVMAFRDQARRGVRAWCRRHRVKFISNRTPPFGLKSEADWRRLRLGALQRWRRELGAGAIVLAHHRDDLTETRLLRLIRGSGPQGLMGMRLKRGVFWRPLLELSRAELVAYAERRRLRWIDDPSNGDQRAALRNWLRHDWLPRLERRQSGAAKALARSLENLAAEATDVELSDYVGLRRAALDPLTPAGRRAAVAGFLRALGCEDYGRSHVSEFLKRLNAGRERFEFEMAGFLFRVTSELVWASRVCDRPDPMLF
jgi:tRNA(Ile)-lysidine synthase